jgi:Bacterial Ig-like domain (group 3)/Fn3 associated/Beta-propeller repeat
VTKLNPTGSALVYSTFLGGGFNEYGEGIAVDKSGRAYVSGSGGPGFPLTPDAIDTNVGYYLTVFNPSGSDLFFSSFAPGSQLLALDCLENVVVTGSANPAIFVTTPGAFQRTSHANPTSISKIVFNGATTTSIISLENPTTSGSSATFKATVAAAAGSDVSTGKLIFIIDGVVAPFVELDGSGEASYTASDLAAGAHRVVASYLGDPAKYSASSNELTENVTGQVATPTFAEIGGTFQNPLHVKIETTTPGAAIYYTTDSTTPGIGSTLYTTPFAVSATVTVKAIAVVSGDTSSPVATATFTVLPTAIRTTTVLQSTPNPSTSGQAVTFTATVTAASGPTPTGSVTFKHSAVVMGTAPLIGGVAQLTVSNLDPADHAVNATYTGNSSDSSSVSGVIWQQVNP